MNKLFLSVLGLGALAAFAYFGPGRADEGTPLAEKKNAAFEDFTLKNLEGKELDTAKLRKGKVAVVKFGSIYCSWCNRMTPEN